jgi:DNA-binding CsgD family transcriptional regulator
VREHEVLGLLADGMTAEEVGHQLGISGATARTHVRNAVARLGARTRTHAVAKALRAGELSSDERQAP